MKPSQFRGTKATDATSVFSLQPTQMQQPKKKLKSEKKPVQKQAVSTEMTSFVSLSTKQSLAKAYARKQPKNDPPLDKVQNPTVSSATKTRVLLVKVRVEGQLESSGDAVATITPVTTTNRKRTAFTAACSDIKKAIAKHDVVDSPQFLQINNLKKRMKPLKKATYSPSVGQTFAATLTPMKQPMSDVIIGTATTSPLTLVATDDMSNIDALTGVSVEELMNDYELSGTVPSVAFGTGNGLQRIAPSATFITKPEAKQRDRKRLSFFPVTLPTSNTGIVSNFSPLKLTRHSSNPNLGSQQITAKCNTPSKQGADDAAAAMQVEYSWKSTASYTIECAIDLPSIGIDDLEAPTLAEPDSNDDRKLSAATQTPVRTEPRSLHNHQESPSISEFLNGCF